MLYVCILTLTLICCVLFISMQDNSVYLMINLIRGKHFMLASSPPCPTSFSRPLRQTGSSPQLLSEDSSSEPEPRCLCQVLEDFWLRRSRS